MALQVSLKGELFPTLFTNVLYITFLGAMALFFVASQPFFSLERPLSTLSTGEEF